jgi:hypothetical protein
VALPVDAASLDEADAAIELWEHYKRRKLDDGQRLDVAVMLATRSDGLWAAAVTGHEKPRQSGKGDSVEVVEFWGLTQRCERILHTIHDAVLLASETQSRMLSLFEHPDLRRLKAREWKGTGQQMIEMRNGGIIWYRTRTGAGGRGLDEVDRLVVDEAQHAEQQHLNSITATQAVSANPQLNVLGTGGLEGKSAWWWSLRKQAKGPRGQFGWVGYSAQPWELDADGRVVLGHVDPFDRDLWWSTIPGLVAGRVSIDFLERELRVLGPDGFAQEYLCVWAPPVDLGEHSVVSLARWDELEAESSPIVSGETFALDVSPDRRHASFAVAGRCADDSVQIEVFDSRPGTSWVVERAIKLHQDHRKPLRIEKGGPAGSFVTLLTEAGVTVEEVSTADHARATGQFIDAVSSGSLRHLGDAILRSAIVGATLRHSGDADLWSRRSSKVDITPLVAATLALGGVPDPVKTSSVFMAFT